MNWLTQDKRESVKLPPAFCFEAVEELNMLDQDDLARERDESRLRTQRADASFTNACREHGYAEGLEEGLLVGRIEAFQEMLGQGVTGTDILYKRSREQLQMLADQLRDEWSRSKQS